MGWNSVIFLCNDGQGAIDRDPAGWWSRARNALSDLLGRPANKPLTFGFNGFCNQWQAVWNEHADYNGVIIVGQNHASVIGLASGFNGHDTEAEQIAILKQILLQKGYNVVKLPKAVR